MPAHSMKTKVLSSCALPVALAAGSSLLLASPAHAAAISWAAAADGQWKQDANWNPRGAPDSDTAEVAIAKAAAVTLNGTASVKTLTIDDAGAKLIGNGTLKIKDTATLTKGKIYWKDSSFTGLSMTSRLHIESGATLDLVSSDSFTWVELSNSGTTNIRGVKIGTNNVPAKVKTNMSVTNKSKFYFTSEVPADAELEITGNSYFYNESSSSAYFEAGAGGKRTLTGDVQNYGTMYFEAPTTINGSVNNEGHLPLYDATLLVKADTTIGHDTSVSENKGHIDIAKDKRLTVKGKLINRGRNSVEFPEGTIYGEGTLVMPNDKLFDKGKISCKRAQSLFVMTGDTSEPDPVLTIEGDYEKSDGTLEVAITGSTPYSYEVPRIHVIGHAEILGGDLDVSFSGPYPGLGAKFSVMTSSQPISGAFASSTVQAGDVVFGVTYNDPDNIYNPYNVTLQVLSVPTPGSAVLLGLAGAVGSRRRRAA